ncbi:hypothetical protein [Taibaiella koreensis]|uniref:hypothetical protein n=1 Tax=Taibaiella koreensis TaxID=1268548 RepID=UPI000E59FC75|nr:hypothetical protein [Taibaiella koreensis]
MKRQIFLLLSLALFLASCTKQPKDYPPEPQIYYLSLRPQQVNLNDTAGVLIELKFTDGDGDIGTDRSGETKNIFLKDSRDTSSSPFTLRQPFPYIEDYMRPTKGGLEGFLSINMGRQFFSVTDSLHLALRKDTLYFNIYVEDDAGHKSNVVQTDPIYLEF